VGVGIAAFVSTNIDDLLILMAFFATPRFPPFQIVLGQYIGMGSLIAVSLLGLLIALVVPRNLIGLIGLFPIAIGIKELLELHKKSNDYDNKDNSFSIISIIIIIVFLFFFLSLLMLLIMFCYYCHI
jgi:cadmium resistance protein CadD (predicted permease)